MMNAVLCSVLVLHTIDLQVDIFLKIFPAVDRYENRTENRKKRPNYKMPVLLTLCECRL